MFARLALLALLLAGTGAGALLLADRPEPVALRDTAAPVEQGSSGLCRPQIANAWVLARALPLDDLTRKYAESDLSLAAIEESGGEIDECQELVERAVETIRTHPYALRPGETLDTAPRAPLGANGRG